METNISIFKVKDTVFDIRYGWGEVTSNDPKAKRLEVLFGSGAHRFYCNGLSDVSLLSFTEYRLEGFSQERPDKFTQESPEKGQIVWVRISAIYPWVIAHFIRFENGHYFVSRENSEKQLIAVRQLTTKNPYKQQKNEN